MNLDEEKRNKLSLNEKKIPVFTRKNQNLCFLKIASFCFIILVT